MMRLIAISIVGMAVAVLRPSAQEAAFEVASVKITKSREGGWQFLPSGDVEIKSAPLGYVIALAFDVPWSMWRHKFALETSAQKIGLPEYPRVEIRGKGKPANDPRAMLRTLLRDRFGLRMHKEKREVPVYALTLKSPGKLGRWLQSSPHNCREFIARGGKLNDANSPKKGDIEICWPWAKGAIKRDGEAVEMSAGTIDDLIARTQGLVRDRPIVDMTGLSGNFMWEIAGGAYPQPGQVFSIFEDQLGLRFESRRSSIEIYVIDDVRFPTPN